MREFVIKRRINGPRRSRVKIGLRPPLAFLLLITAGAAIDLVFESSTARHDTVAALSGHALEKWPMKGSAKEERSE